MEDVSTENGFGIVADLDDYNCKERIIDFYRSIDDIQLEIKCQKFVDETCKENDAWARAVSNVLR